MNNETILFTTEAGNVTIQIVINKLVALVAVMPLYRAYDDVVAFTRSRAGNAAAETLLNSDVEQFIKDEVLASTMIEGEDESVEGDGSGCEVEYQ